MPLTNSFYMVILYRLYMHFYLECVDGWQGTQVWVRTMPLLGCITSLINMQKVVRMPQNCYLCCSCFGFSFPQKYKFYRWVLANEQLSGIPEKLLIGIPSRWSACTCN